MENDNKKKSLYALVYTSISSNFDSELWAPYTQTRIFDDYHKAVGHLTVGFTETLERLKKDAYFNNKKQPEFEQKCDRSWIKYCGKYENWEIDEVTVQ